MKYTEQDLKDEYEQAVKRKGKLYAEGYVEGLKDAQTQALTIPVVSFELPNDDIFDKSEVSLNNPLEEFYYYERPAYLEDDQKQFRERLQKALNYLKGN